MTAATCNKPQTTTDANGNVTTYTYDNTTGVLLQVVKPAVTVGSGTTQIHPTTNYTYNPFAANIKTPSGSTAPGSSISLLTDVSTCNTTSSCAGTADETHTHITYDANRNLAVSSVTTYAGNLAQGTGSNALSSCPSGSVCSSQSFSYDAFGNLATSTSPLGAVTTYAYDADRELTGVIGPDPDGSGPLTPAAAQVVYDGNGRVIATKTGSVNSPTDTGFSSFTLNTYASYNYDAAGRLSSKFDGLVTNGTLGPAFAATQYGYDPANNLQCTAVRMNPAGLNGSSLPGACSQGAAGTDGVPDRITLRTYNADNSLGSVTSGYGTSAQRNDVSSVYSADGTLGSQSDGKGNKTCYAYDGFGRTVTVQYPTASSGGACNSGDINIYSYDANGNPTAKGLRGGGVLTYTYDALNRLTKDGDGSTYTYDLQGRLTGSSSGVAVSMAYDALGRKTAESDSYGGATYALYDAAGDRTQLSWQGGGPYVAYARDLLGRVTAIGENGATSGVGLLGRYTYDSFGRMSGESFAGGSIGEAILYGSDSRPCITGYSFGGDSSKNVQNWLTYNAAGQVKVRLLTNDLYDWSSAAAVQQGYTINGLNQVATTGATTFGYDGRGSLSSDGTYTYGYTPLEQLSSLQAGGASATLTYDGQHRLAQTQGASTTRLVYDGSALSEELDNSGKVLARYVPGADGSPLLWYSGSGTSDRRWLLKDQQGSVISVANSSGQSLATNTYDAYGLSGSSNLGRFQYAGYAFVPEVGLYNTGARSYSPTLGRFLQTDPSGYSAGMNIYAYTRGDPVNYVDRNGKFPEPAEVGIGAFVGAGAGLISFAATPHPNFGTFAVDVFGGAALGGALAAVDPSFGIITVGAVAGGALDAAGQLTTNNKFNGYEVAGATIGGFTAGGVGAGILHYGMKNYPTIGNAVGQVTANVSRLGKMSLITTANMVGGALGLFGSLSGAAIGEPAESSDRYDLGATPPITVISRSPPIDGNFEPGTTVLLPPEISIDRGGGGASGGGDLVNDVPNVQFDTY